VAGDWLPIRLDLARDPAILGIARSLECPVALAVGGVVIVWAWANEQLPEGDAPSVSIETLERLIGVPGLPQAMIDVGWLETTKTGIRLPNFDVWNSGSAKKRLLRARRNRSYRRRSRDAKGDAPETLAASPIGEERKGKTNPPTSPQGDDVDSDSIPESSACQNGRAPPGHHERTRELCTLLDRGRRHWREDVATMAGSSASLRAMDGLLRGVRGKHPPREPEAIEELIGWLFGGESGDYEPRSTSFDWRRVVRTAAALAKNWDTLADERRASLEERR
jgi:hypothetical protein